LILILTDSATAWGSLAGCLRAVAAFAAVLLAPGYLLGWACDLFGFRGRVLNERLAWGVALSLAVTPLATTMLAKYGSLTAAYWVAGSCGMAWVGVVARDLWHGSLGWSWRRSWMLGAGIAAAWALFCFAELADAGVGSKLYLSVTIYDHALRTAFVDAVLRTGVPPANPLYWPRHAAPMRYYYFWYVVTAVAARLGRATARQALMASVVWAGLGLAAVVDLYCRHFLGELGGSHPTHRDETGMNGAQGTPERNTHISEARCGAPRLVAGRGKLALALLAVTGLDVVPALVKALARMPADADMEWWSQAQIASWMDSVLWVPHHVAGLVCCLLGFLLVWMSGTTKDLRGARRWLCAGIAGVGFASGFGLSTWVALAFAMTMAVWLVWVLGWERSSRRRAPVLLAAGVVAVVLLLPYLAELRGEASGAQTVAGGGADAAAGAGHLLRFGVRHIIDPGALLGVPGFAQLARTHPRLEDAVAGLVLLLPGYITELGFYGLVLVAAVWAARRRGLDDAERTALLLTLTALGLATFLRSALVANNDFGTRSVLVAQFFLLLLAVRWFEGGLGAQASRPQLRFAMMAMLWVGVAGTAYQAVLLRAYLPVQERLGNPELVGLAERAKAWRVGFAEMDRRVPKDEVIQFNTAQPNDFFGYAQILFAGRQMGNALPVCAAAFGGDPAECQGILHGIAAMYQPHADGMPGPGAGRAECARYGFDDLVATRWDVVWNERRSWVWAPPVVVDTGDMRVLDCGRARLPPAR
jgi:hypothetical protein